MRLCSHAGGGPRHMPSHAGGGGWPGGLGGIPPGLSGSSASIFGDGTARGGITGTYTCADGVWTVTGAATVDIAAETGAAVLMGKRLVVDGGTLTVSTNAKGLLLFMSELIEVKNGGRIHIDKLGKAGDFGNQTAWASTPEAWRGKLNKTKLETYVVLGEGAAGAPARTSSVFNDGTTGSAAGAMQTGGGGSGGLNTAGGSCTIGKGGKGGPCCGGGGSGAVWTDGSYSTADCADYGPGGNGNGNAASPGGAGDPVGVGAVGGNNGEGAGGGLLMLFSPVLTIGSGCVVSADGARGGNGSGSYYPSGGCAGGGCVCIVTVTGGYSNAGTVRANGGVGYPAVHGKGGDGGAGSVNIFSI